MYVEARAHVRNEDVRRILNKAECEPGDRFELDDGLAEVYLKNGWAVQVAKAEAGQTIEFAANSGAPENAMSQRGRGGLRTGRGGIPVSASDADKR